NRNKNPPAARSNDSPEINRNGLLIASFPRLADPCSLKPKREDSGTERRFRPSFFACLDPGVAAKPSAITSVDCRFLPISQQLEKPLLLFLHQLTKGAVTIRPGPPV